MNEGVNRWSYIWDYENRLTQASTRKQKVRYKFDALGRRVQRIVNYGQENTKFIYDGLDVIADDNSGTLTKYQNGPGIDNKLRVQTGSDVKYFLADHLGSTNGLAEGSGSLSALTSYDSFGNPTNANFPSRYQFTGREFDNFTGLQFSRARFYDPKIGRFVSEDPVGFVGGINLYAYAKSSPQHYKDPKGHNPCVASWAAAGSVGGAVFGGGVGLAGVVGGGVAVIVTEPGGLALGSAAGGFAGTAVGALVCPGTLPFPNQTDLTPTASRQPPICQPSPKAMPWGNWPPITYPIPLGPYPPKTPEEQQDCVLKCSHLLDIGDYGVQYLTCYRRCMGTIE